MKDKTQHITKLIRNYISTIDPNAEVILYGSRARGDEHIDSDWDILILTNYQINVEIERKFRNELYDLELETGESFSVFAYSKNDWQNIQKVTPFYQNILKEGVNL
jgi:predicted nucleotidyltransferase